MTDDPMQQATVQPDRLFDHIRKFIDGIEDRPVLPSQFFESNASPVPPGEKMIRYRMLRDAIREFRRYAFATGKRGLKAYQETYDWLITNDYEWPYSFVNLCEVFSLDVEAVRAALLRWKLKEQEKREAKAAKAAESPRPEPCPQLQEEGGTDEASERTEGRDAEQAA
jgi:hypothetical protein